MNRVRNGHLSGSREIDGIVNGAMQAAQDMVNKRLGKGSGSGGGEGGGGGGGGKGAVVELTEQSFQTKVLDSEDLWIVAFTAPWCGHCKNLIPHFERASADLKVAQPAQFPSLLCSFLWEGGCARACMCMCGWLRSTMLRALFFGPLAPWCMHG